MRAEDNADVLFVRMYDTWDCMKLPSNVGLADSDVIEPGRLTQDNSSGQATKVPSDVDGMGDTS